MRRTADSNLNSDISEDEECHKVYSAQAEDLRVLVHSSVRRFRFLGWRLAGFLQAV